jgi:hypothetical protein
MNFEFNADPDPAFHSNADPDPASKSDAELDPDPIRIVLLYSLIP